MNQFPDLFIAIDEHGRVLHNEARVEDQATLQIFFDSLEVAPNKAIVSQFRGTSCLVEAFDEPWVIIDLAYSSQQAGRLVLTNTYGFTTIVRPETCFFDEWDRVHGATENGVPWVLARSAQEKFFDLLDEFDDESFSLHGQKFTPQPAFFSEKEIQESQWWTDVYKNEVTPGWDLKLPHPAFTDTFPRMKQPRSRVLILGAGEGHDASYFSQMGHLVTAVDFSEEAIARAKNNYQSFPINFMQGDAFHLPRVYDKSFDLVVEHTFYCAIPPDRRNELVSTWNRCLVSGGLLMGVFFVTEKRGGPPFGASEWEIRQRLQPDYHILFWGRWRQSPGGRQGKELFVLAQKK